VNSPIASSDMAAQHWRLGVVTLCCAVFWSLGGCARHTVPAPAAVVVVAAPVHAVVADRDAFRLPAEVIARYSNAMSFRIGGKLIERRVRLGDSVKGGQILARLDPADAEQQATSAQAALEAANHRLTFSQQQLDRDRAQSEQNLIAAAQLEQTQDAYTAALAARDQAAAQLAVARNNLRYNTLYAEHDGQITSENADTGQVVAAGQIIFGLAWSGDTDIAIDAPQDRMDEIRIGQHATVSFPARPSRLADAQVREIAPAADPYSRTYRIRLTLTSPDRDLRLGMTGDAVLAVADDIPPASASPSAAVAAGRAAGPVFVVPATAIFHQGSQAAVWIVRASDSKLELRSVTIRRYGAQTATISSGLRDGDTVLLAGVHTVFAGELVHPVAPLYSATDSSTAGPTTEPVADDSARAGSR
jgi:multidrug efflux system membrane fusion protein